MFNVFLRVSLALSFLLISACAATPQADALLATQPESLPSRVELTATPFYPQTEHQCGPAALATVMQARGINVTPDALTSLVYLPEREGSLQIEMIATARRYGLLPYPLAPQLHDVLAEVTAGHPVLVMQNLGLESLPQWHYAVVIGYDLARAELVLRSGTTERWAAPFDVFERTWQRAGFWALVLVSPETIPATATADRYLLAAHDFEQVGQTDAARMAYQAAVERWPEQAAPWLMQGNLAFSAEDYVGAIDAFQQSILREPNTTSGWNNLAYALDARGCSAQARMALHCAQEVAPDDANVQDSIRELSARAIAQDHPACPQIQCAP
jgi:tetratricopeptide (TPR) repeat protein